MARARKPSAILDDPESKSKKKTKKKVKKKSTRKKSKVK